MPTINLTSQSVEQNFIVDEGSAFSLKFKNTNGAFPSNYCAVMRLQYTVGGPPHIALPDSRIVMTTNIQNGRYTTTGYVTADVYRNQVITTQFSTARPTPPIIPGATRNYSMLSMQGDTITLEYPQDMTTMKVINSMHPVPTLTNTTVIWYNIDKFSMPYNTAVYELFVVAPNNIYRPMHGTITKNAFTITSPSAGLPNCQIL